MSAKTFTDRQGQYLAFMRPPALTAEQVALGRRLVEEARQRPIRVLGSTDSGARQTAVLGPTGWGRSAERWASCPASPGQGVQVGRPATDRSALTHSGVSA